MRLDILLTEKQLARSRSTAVLLIKEGKVIVDGKVIIKPSTEVYSDSVITITDMPPYVSRAGAKIAHALDYFKIDVEHLTAIDIGASTGGFTDCLLQRGIRKVYAVDVGTDQLDANLRNNDRVVVMEQTDIRKAELPELVDLAVIDVSFISLTHILQKTYELLKQKGVAVVLIKPQFEVGKDNVGKKGIVSDVTLHKTAIDTVIDFAHSVGFYTYEVITSPIKGTTGNTEYLTCFVKKA